ncbi:MAG TPA: hypothetical protein VGK41_01275 [Solirubrobacterales bacterium]
MRTSSLTVLIAGFLLALLFNDGPVGTLAIILWTAYWGSSIAGVRWRIEVDYLGSGLAVIARSVVGIAGVALLLLAAAYVWEVVIKDSSIRFDTPGWLWYGLLPTIGAAMVWAAWGQTPKDESTQAKVDRALLDLSRRKLEP